jgi:hypothetical protein
MQSQMTMQTYKARRVLNDAKAALDKFDQEPIDVDFRHLVVLCCTLIRTVGDVLRKENEGNEISNAAQRSYYFDNIKDSDLFKNFIKDARDMVIHEYSAKIGWKSTIDLNKVHKIEYPLLEGMYKGYDFRTMIKESIDFWDHHISKMENGIK